MNYCIIPTSPGKNSWPSLEPKVSTQTNPGPESSLRKPFPVSCDLVHPEGHLCCRWSKLAQEFQDRSLIWFSVSPTSGCPRESPREKRGRRRAVTCLFPQNQSHRCWVRLCRCTGGGSQSSAGGKGALCRILEPSAVPLYNKDTRGLQCRLTLIQAKGGPDLGCGPSFIAQEVPGFSMVKAICWLPARVLLLSLKPEM